MASTSTGASFFFSIPVSEKLSRDNYLVWRAQVLPAIRGARLVGILDGSIVQPSPTIKTQKADQSIEEVENPAYDRWVEQDQHLLSYLLSTMTKEVLVQVSSCEHAAEVWNAIKDMFAS